MKLRINESNIPESDAEELYRIAEYELLPETQLYKISEHCTIDEDTFEYTYTGTAWGGYICYDIYMEWTAEYLPRIGDFYRDNIDDVWHRDWKLNEIKIYFNIYVEGDKVTVEIADMDIVEPKNFEKVFDLDALCDAIREIAEKSANYIHSKIGAYEPYDDMDESVGMRESKDGIMLKSVNSSGTWYLIKSATRNKSFWNKSISYVNEFAKKESALNKLYAVLQKLPDNAFYYEDDMSDFENIDDLKNAKFAKFYITDTGGNTIEDISDEVKDHLLNDDKFIDSALDDFDDELDEAFIHDETDEIDRSNAVKFSRDLKDRVKVGSLFLSKNGVGEDYKVVDIYQGGRGSYYVTLKIIKDSYGAKYSSVGRKIYSVPISNLYNMLFIE